MEYTPVGITRLAPNEIFVFGSNERGEHRGGAAHIAFELFGATWGTSVGISGNTYAIPTLDKNWEKVEEEMLYIHLVDFATYVREHPELKFYLTRIGCGIAGWEIPEVKKILWEALGYSQPANLVIPYDFQLTERDFNYIDDTLYINHAGECIGAVFIPEAPREVERLNLQEQKSSHRRDVVWEMDFHKTLIDVTDEENDWGTDLCPGYCWVVRKDNTKKNDKRK